MSIAGTLQDSVNIRYVFTISGTPTTVNGADDNSRTLAYTAGQADVYLNGVKQVVGTDVTATSGSSVVFASALAANDIVEVVAFDTFQAANVDAGAVASGTLSNDRLPTIDDSKLGAGSILQVVSTTKTDTFSTSTGGSFVDITGLSVAITPRSTSSKIFVVVNTQVGGDEMFYIRLVRGSTAIAVADDDGANRIESTQGGVFQASNNDKAAPMGCSFLDSPNTTSETTYKLQVRRHTAGSGLKVNASFSDSDSIFTGRGVSTITAMEVQG